jgi:hypothetical protein
MKNLLIISLFFLFANVGCTNKEDMASKKLGDTFQLKAGESISFSDNSNAINVKLITIQDSRCPKDVQCIRAGEAIVILDLQIGDEQFKGLKVCIGCEKEMAITELTEIKTKSKTYTLKLNSVDPYPQSTGLATPTATLVLN